MDKQKIIDATHKIADELENNAAIYRAKEEAKVKAYYDGYSKACDDFGRKIRMMVFEEKE